MGMNRFDRGFMKKQKIIRIAVIAAIVGFADWKLITVPKIMDGIPGENAVDGFRYNGIDYRNSYFMVADADRIHVGYAEETRGKVYFIGSRTSPDYIAIVGSDNTTHYAAEGCVPDTSGTVTKVLIDPGIRKTNKLVITRKSDMDQLLAITNLQGEEKEYTIENIYTQGNDFYFACNDCVVVDSNNLGGYIALTGGEWIYASPENYKAMLNDMNQRESNKGTVRGVRITDEKLIEWLGKSILTSFIEE